MDLADTASGTMLVKRPGKMRWTYEKPEEQIIVTDGGDLWIYKPADNQVAVGQAPTFFADGKGASFLSDMKLVREKFTIRLDASVPDSHYVLNLTPHGTAIDIAAIYLTVAAQTYDITRIVTYNAYGDENRIEFANHVFNAKLDESLFSFEIPPGADVVQLGE